MKNTPENVRAFWDKRAKDHGAAWTATLGEKYLRLLEIKKMSALIKKYKPQSILDVGCGNGYSTKIYAKKFPLKEFIGIDFSEDMIFNAKKEKMNNCDFFVGDVLDFNTLPNKNFNFIFTQRCLQNLENYEKQKLAINNLLKLKSKKGVLLLMECSKDGVKKLNAMRVKLGKEPKEGIEPWHNCFFNDIDLIQDFDAKIIHFTSTYMFFAKVLNPKYTQIGYFLPQVGNFGYDKLYIIT